MASHPPSAEQIRQWLADHGDLLYRYAVSLVRDRATAEELVQETFLAALKSARRFRGRSTPQTWLTGILRHKVMDHFRSLARRANVSAVDLDDLDQQVFDAKGAWLTPPAPWPSDPHSVLKDCEFREVLNRCLDKLDAVKRGVIMLRVFEELSSKEVCKELGITATNLWVLMHRARGALRDCLEKNWFGGQES